MIPALTIIDGTLIPEPYQFIVVRIAGCVEWLYCEECGEALLECECVQESGGTVN